MKLSEILKYEEEFMANDRNGLKERPTFSYVLGNMPIMITAPHTVKTMKISQGEIVKKASEPFTGAICKILSEKLGCYAMYRNNYPDKYTDPMKFTEDLSDFVLQNNILYLLDLHGLSKSSPSEIALGTSNGEFIYYNNEFIRLFDESFDLVDIIINLYSKFQGSNPKTICKNVFEKTHIPVSQVEINYFFRNPKEDINSINRLLFGLCIYIEEIEKYLSKEKTKIHSLSLK